MRRKLRMGMVGGGRDAFIGAVHRIAAFMDGEIEMVCGALSSNIEKARQSGEDLHLSPERIYGSYEEMVTREKELPADQRMDFVSIVTPNHLHFGPAKMAMENGFHVVLDKPATFTLEEAKTLKKVIEDTGALFCLTHTYTGYPMVKEARQVIASGKLGNIRKIYVEYPQGWLTNFREGSNYKQAAWRTDPKRSGISGCMGDIGTHAFNMAEYVSGHSVIAMCADMNIVVPGRLLDDDGSVLLKFNNGVSGFLFATQVAAGEENNIKIRVYGDKAGLEWKQEDANSLLLKWLEEPTQILRAGNPYLSSYSRAGTRTPAGHPEGYLEAFANIYRNFAYTLGAKLEGKRPEPEWTDFPGIEEGIRGMAFIENVVRSAASEMKWQPFEV
ncbi:Gfo/Idh/MocA family protein [Flavihumibacter profundi]|jgi:predicted dehydrogenase|uniref:Gfo/Idh/MocA family protein n=1 Tax=Flavihumibacter profundi TaxID=2716883 RepID=UPI001CC6DE90|nr:Gfo/Idh/MocA family oxidoreductase [Flavihumibacter profundi]MBZ5855674.1 Gfo/Idh/MocA family oxidoreductase [Flavihumibacter profundi]